MAPYIILVMNADEISRKALSHLKGTYPKPARFKEMSADLGIDQKALSKNLFYLEENQLVRLATSIEGDATFPTIHVVKLTDEGSELAGNKEKLEERFSSRKAKYHDQELHEVTFAGVLDRLAGAIEKDASIESGKKKSLLKNIGELKELGIAGSKVFG